MRRVLLIALLIAALLLASFTSYLGLRTLYLSLHAYRTPLKTMPSLVRDTTPPLTSQVVLVIIDGLRYDTSLQMPYLNSLRQSGAQAQLVSTPPSDTQAAWVTLISGTSPELSDMPLFDRETELLRPIPTDHLFACMQRADRTAGIAGFVWWQNLVNPSSLYVRYYTDKEDDKADQEVVQQAVRFVQEFRPSLLLVNLRQVEAAGWRYGGASPEYLHAAQHCDEYLNRLAESMDLQSSVLIICSSHGHVDAGGHGGNEVVTLTTPLVIVGQNIAPGDYGVLDQNDVAATVATLLGAPIPSTAQGHLPWHMLRMELSHKAQKLMAVARQRLRLGNAYLFSIAQSSLSKTPEGDILVAESSLELRNYQSAAELAEVSAQQTDAEMSQARRSRVWAERVERAPFAAAAVLLPLWVVWMKHGKRTLAILILALLAVVVYHHLFLRTGNMYSFSHIPIGKVPDMLVPNLKRAVMASAAGGALLAVWLWMERERSAFLVLKAGYGYGLLQVYFAAVLVAACFCWNGLTLTWYVPHLTVVFVHLSALMHAMIIAGLGTVMPVPILVVQKFLLALSDAYTRFARARRRAQSQRQTR